MKKAARQRISPVWRLRHAAEIVAVHALAAIMLLLPRRWVHALGRGAGALLYAAAPALRRVARANLDIAFGADLSPTAKRRVARHGLQNATATLLGLLWAPRLNRHRLERLVDVDPQGLETVRRLHAERRGIVFFTMHYGDWELLGLAMGFWGVPTTIVQESMRNRWLADWFARRRGLSGHTVVPGRHAALSLLKTLKRGGNVALLLDLNASRKRGGIWIDFFGVPVFHSPATAALSLRTGAVIVCAAAHPLPGGRSRMVLSPPIEPVSTSQLDDDIRALSQRCLDSCAEIIRGEPDHWLWTYKRWKFRSGAERGRYPWYSAPLDRSLWGEPGAR